jgi:hypothetical protein
MHAMRNTWRVLLALWLSPPLIGQAQEAAISEAQFREALGVNAQAQLTYRSQECQPLSFAEFATAMRTAGVTSEVMRAPDGSAVVATLHRKGAPSCASPFAPVTDMPAFDLKDLNGQRVTSASLRGKPTLMNFYFAQCKPCILEVGPLNKFAAARQDLNFLAVTFDEPGEAKAFVQRFRFRWRVVPGAREFIDRMAVNRYPMMALFDARGRLLGLRAGGVKDELEAATLGPTLTRWVDNLLRTQ